MAAMLYKYGENLMRIPEKKRCERRSSKEMEELITKKSFSDGTEEPWKNNQRGRFLANNGS